jgi:RNA polymerase sigma-70 factor, ECF subfamily
MDDKLFEEIYEMTARPLWAYVARISGSATAADDIVQETYLRFLHSPPRAAVIEEAKPYLYKIATNLARDRFRRMRRESNSEYMVSSAADEKASSDFAEEAEMMQVFSRLKQQERALLWLAYIEGYEHREIAGILKLNRMSVRVLLFRARRKLALVLESEKK